MRIQKKSLWSFLIMALFAISVPGHIGANEAPRVVEISAKRFQFTPNLITLKKG